MSATDAKPTQAESSGTLTAEKVRELMEENSRQYPSPTDPYVWLTEYDWQAIADELNATLGESPRLPYFWTHDGVLHIEATRMPTRIVVCEGGTCEFVPKRELDASEAENAKLRELVWDLYCLAYPSTVEWEVSDETYDKYSPCEKCQELHGGKSPCAGTAKDMTEECCAPIQASVVADRMRELGVEVDG